jgi:ferredoxin
VTRQIWARVDHDKCFSFGRCLDLAPRVFEWDESGLSVGGRLAPEDFEAARKAAQSCPRFAITLVEDEEEEEGDPRQ